MNLNCVRDFHDYSVRWQIVCNIIILLGKANDSVPIHEQYEGELLFGYSSVTVLYSKMNTFVY